MCKPQIFKVEVLHLLLDHHRSPIRPRGHRTQHSVESVYHFARQWNIDDPASTVVNHPLTRLVDECGAVLYHLRKRDCLTPLAPANAPARLIHYHVNTSTRSTIHRSDPTARLEKRFLVKNQLCAGDEPLRYGHGGAPHASQNGVGTKRVACSGDCGVTTVKHVPPWGSAATASAAPHRTPAVDPQLSPRASSCSSAWQRCGPGATRQRDVHWGPGPHNAHARVEHRCFSRRRPVNYGSAVRPTVLRSENKGFAVLVNSVAELDRHGAGLHACGRSWYQREHA